MSHDYVLIPESFKVKKGEILDVHLFVTYGFNIVEEKIMQKTPIRNFKLYTENGIKDLLKETKEGDLPFLKTKVDFDGQALICLERDYSKVALTNDEFEEYLKSDNIENITIDKTKQIQTERYSRYIKSLVQSDEKLNSELYNKVVGYNYEIILLDNPYKLKEGDWIKAQVLFMGKHVDNQIVTARNRKDGDSAIYQYSRTDKNGICSFKLERKGDWFIHTTHIIPCPNQEEAIWESFWASYSFGL